VRFEIWGTEVFMMLAGALASISLGWLIRLNIDRALKSDAAERLRHYHAKLSRELSFVRAGMSARSVIAIQGGCLFVGLLLVVSGNLAGLFVGCAAGAPVALLRRARTQRVIQIEAQLEGWLGSLSRSLEAAPSLGEALEVSIGMCDAPMREELKLLVNELHLGRPLGAALDKWAARVGSHVFHMAIGTLQMGRETGGRLGEVLESTAASLREMDRLEGVVRTKTAEGKFQAMVIAVVPFPLYVAVRFFDPRYFVALESTPMGHMLLGVAACLWLGAGLSARKILAVQI
jgi:tight adherence protein B